MTIENAKKMLTNTKVYVNGKSKEIQEKLFEIGFSWRGIESNNISNLGAPFLFVKNDISYSNSMITFRNSLFTEVSADDILNIKLDEEFIPKKGDIIFVKSGSDIFIEIFASLQYDCLKKEQFWCSYYISSRVELSVNFGGYLYTDEIDELRLATEEEKSKLFSALKKKGLFWNEETKQVEKIKKEREFKPFDKVLVRDFCNDNWDIEFFQEIGGEDIDYKYICLSNEWNFCIPYEGNEELLGTSNSPK